MTIVQIKGPIIPNNHKDFYDEWGMESTAPKDIVLPDNGEDIEIHINSGGGSVFAGSEIFTALKSYSGKKVVKIVGLAASAASVIAMAGDVIEMSPTAQMMIHNVSSFASGDHTALRKEADVIEAMNQSIANAYIIKSGKSMDELLDLMGDTTWFTAQKAVSFGLADSVMFQDELPELVASESTYIPEGVVNSFYSMKKLCESQDKLINTVLERLDKVEAENKERKEQPVAHAEIVVDADQIEEAVKKVIGAVKENEAVSPFAKFVL
ncbi:Clp protease ClpP [Streptococcus suis]|uniref:head maturation protease, ClpP-related n=1 Tax=Streptococcus suis TaxID=1307 RepID=UPI00076955B7|nr:head maturation protease, ClpP-related [Streptococcus suis]MBO4124406.1 Clp protease ClpP [Streptococcus suis]NQH15017.1 Clp protease ClpP [Streptococcus suis]CYU88267.1 scaffolding protein [Streptococcus suis]HEM3480713.1 Clp protease ClpP [Streptococcus suis]